MVKKIREFLPFFILIFVSLALRLAVINSGFHVDILSNAGWGEWIYKNGPKGFYDNSIWVYSWPTQLPLVNLLYAFSFSLFEWLKTLFVNISTFIALHRLAPTYFIWWFDFTRWFGMEKFTSFWTGATGFNTGALISLKLLSVLADIAIGIFIFFLAGKDRLRGLLLSSLYLILPFSWYLGSVWGQTDQVSFVPLLLSFLAIATGQVVFAPILFLISLAIKPTVLIFAPFFIWLYFIYRPKLYEILMGGVFVVAAVLILVTSFTDKNVLVFGEELFEKVFLKSEFRVSTNAFNFWHILIGARALNENAPFLFIPAKIWGYLAFLILNVLAFRSAKEKTMKDLFVALFIVGAGGWLFLTNMLGRYFFAGVVFGLMLLINRPKLLPYWLCVSLIFFLNLYNEWWFPEWLNSFLKIALEWENGALTRAFSLANVLIFAKILSEIGVKLPKLQISKRFR